MLDWLDPKHDLQSLLRITQILMNPMDDTNMDYGCSELDPRFWGSKKFSSQNSFHFSSRGEAEAKLGTVEKIK